jgi:hypothetical protein
MMQCMFFLPVLLNEMFGSQSTCAVVTRLSLLQGMKDLNLRDEARYQQALQPDMVSSQVSTG